MTGVSIRTRTTKSGRRYQVRYRRGGRGFKYEHAGTFTALRDARTRRDLVSGWLAAGKDPRTELLALKQAANPAPVETVADLCAAFVASRVDVDAKTRASYRDAFRHVTARFGDREPASIAVSECGAFVGSLTAAGLKPGTVRLYVNKFRQLLDFAQVVPNPARDKNVRLPANRRAEHEPPPAEHVLTILANLRPPLRVPFVVMEQTAMRPGEIESLVWGDVDIADSRFRLRGEETKTSRSRWVQVPAWLMDVVSAACPYDDRVPERRVFQVTTAMLRNGIGQACRKAGIPHYSPKALRHRRASLWHGQGVTAAELALRGGWSKATVPLEVYSHVLMDGSEVPVESFREVICPSL